MFRKISIHSQHEKGPENPLDLPFLAEAMLFYGEVEVVTNRTSLRQLVHNVGPEVLIEFVKRGHIKLVFEPNFTGIRTDHSGTPNEVHTPTVFKIERQELLDILRPLVTAIVGKEGKGRRLALRLADQIRVSPIESGLVDRFASDLAAPDYITNAVRSLVRLEVPGISDTEHLRFEMFSDEGMRFRVVTNINFSALNARYHRRTHASHSSLSPAYLLATLFQNRKILEDSARNDAELAVSPTQGALIQSKISWLIDERERSSREIQSFQALVFEGGRSLNEVFASGERTFADLLPVMEKSLRFRNWLQERDITSNLVKEYFSAVTEKSWLDKLPTKAVRWSLFSGAGMLIDTMGAGGLGTLGGILLSAADSFLVEKMLKGWRPDQFIEVVRTKFMDE